MTATIWTNANIVTMNDASPTAEAILSVDERIVAVGPLDDVRQAAPATASTIDLAGATLLPGFIEAHNHMIMYGLGLASIDARPAAAAARAPCGHGAPSFVAR